MTTTIARLAVRKLLRYLPQFIGMNILIVVGVTFFVTLYTIYMSYDYSAESYFESQAYADITFYGSFDGGDVKTVSDSPGIDAAYGRWVMDFKDGDILLRVISLTDSVNTPRLYEGRMPLNENECVLLAKHAQARGIELGGTVSPGGKPLVVTGLAASPEYVYLVRNERALMDRAENFGVAFVTDTFFSGPFNEIVAVGSLSDSCDYGDPVNARETIYKEDQLNYIMYLSDLEQIRTFAFIFPLIFTLLIIMIIYVLVRRSVIKDRRQIGVCKALGAGEGQIVFIYVSQAFFTAVVGAVLGCVAAMLICDTIIGFFSVMFEVPGLSFIFYPALWAGAILVSAFICAISALLSVRSILRPLPAALMRARMPSGGRQILMERISIWKKLSFNTRYAMKSAFRNKGRFIAVLMGMCGSCGLLVFALGFFDSTEYTQTSYFNDFTRYDALIEFDPIPMTTDHIITEKLGETSRALAAPVEIDGSEYRLIIVEDGFDMLGIETEKLKSGVVIPGYYADKWNKDIGSLLKIDGIDVSVSSLSEQSFGLALYTSFSYAERLFPDLPGVYNIIFARDGDLSKLEDWSREYGFEYSTLEDDRAGFSSVMESLNTLIWFMLACAVILGSMVLYSIGLMNLSAREYEYMFMGIMGYPLKSIMFSHIKETVLQLAFALPCGFILGNILLNSVKSAFSGDSFVMSTAIYPQSYVYSAFIVTAMAALMAVYSALHIRRLDIVEGLKERDE